MPILISKQSKLYRSIVGDIKLFLAKRPFLKEKYLKAKYNISHLRMPAMYRGDSLFKKIYIETISYCNNTCSFCPASAKAGYKKAINFMPIDLYRKILHELKSLDFKGVFAFHCNNEPLLDKRIFDFIAIGKRLFSKNYFYMYTNGLLINADKALALFNVGLDYLVINNYDDDFKLLSGVKDILNHVDPSKVNIFINRELKNTFMSNRAGEMLQMHLKKPFKLTCLRAPNEIIVGYDGTVPLCCADALWKAKMGNVREKGIKDIWFSDKFDRIRKALIAGDRSCNEVCKDCDWIS